MVEYVVCGVKLRRTDDAALRRAITVAYQVAPLGAMPGAPKSFASRSNRLQWATVRRGWRM